MTQLFIIILNFNGGREIRECLNSLIDSNSIRMNSNRNPDKFENYNIIVVDNGSTDGSKEYIIYQISNIKKANQKPKIIGIFNKKNLGFAKGCNVGIRYALRKGAKAVLLLNQDTVVPKGFLEPLLANPADIVAPVIKFKREGKWVYDFGGRVNWWLGRPEHIEFRDVPLASIDYVSGCAMLIRRPVWEKIGLLDEKFFLYFEDIDFCLRAQKAGFKISVEPKSIITHKLSEKKKKPLKQHLFNLKSNFIFINRYLPWYRRKIAYAYLGALFLKIVWNEVLGERFR